MSYDDYDQLIDGKKRSARLTTMDRCLSTTGGKLFTLLYLLHLL